MTVLMREELNDADLAWAMAVTRSGHVTEPQQPACPSRPAKGSDRPAWPHDGRLLEPALLRAWGAL